MNIVSAVNKDNAAEIISENILPLIESYIETYNRRNRTNLLLRWHVLSEYPDNVVVSHVVKEKGDFRIDKQDSMANFIIEAVSYQAIIRGVVKIAIRKAGGEDFVKAGIKQEAASKIAAFLYNEDHRFCLNMYVLNSALKISISDERSGQTVRELSKFELTDIIEREASSALSQEGQNLEEEE